MTTPSPSKLHYVSIKSELRNVEQNRLLWAMLGEVAEQVIWHGQKLAPHEWKDVFTAALKRQKVVPGIDGGFVVIGAHTSRMPKKDMTDLIELMYAFGAEHGVKFTETRWETA